MMSNEDEMVKRLKNFPTSVKYDFDSSDGKLMSKSDILPEYHSLNKSYILKSRKSYITTTPKRLNVDNYKPPCKNSDEQSSNLLDNGNNVSSRTEDTFKTARSISNPDEYLLFDEGHDENAPLCNETMYFDDTNATFILDQFKHEIDNAKQTYGVATPKTVIRQVENRVGLIAPPKPRMEDINQDIVNEVETKTTTFHHENIPNNTFAVASTMLLDNTIDTQKLNFDGNFFTNTQTNITKNRDDTTSSVECDSYSRRELLDALNIYKNIIDMLELKQTTLTEKYKQTIAKCVEDNELLKNDYRALDNSFSELHNRYEKLRQMNLDLKQNQLVLEEQFDKQNELLNLADKKIEEITITSENLLRAANEEIYMSRIKHESEISLIQTSLKLEQSKNLDLEQSLRQKITQNEELTGICDELLRHANMPQ